MAELIAVQCPRCGNQTVAGHRDCLVCGRTIHPEVDLRSRIRSGMEIRGKEVFFYPESSAKLLIAFLYPGPVVLGLLLAFLYEVDLAALTAWEWAVLVLGLLAWVLIVRRFVQPGDKPLLRLDRRGIHFLADEGVLIPWNALERTSGRRSTVRLYGSGTTDILFHLNRELALDIRKDSSLWYDPSQPVVLLRWVLLDAEFAPRAIDFFAPVLTQ